ncbi:hypothetical protein ACWF9B_22015 [Streptomyces sp. NPDC055089]
MIPSQPHRGSWPVGEYAAAQRTQGMTDARVVLSLASDQFLVVVDTTTH